MVELCTRLATERARTVTLHLQAGAREVYPNKPAPRHRPTRQRATVEVLNAIYEMDFIGFSIGASCG